MTNETAINHGKKQLEIFGGEHREFIEVAIKALEQEPCEDCISREAVKEQMIKYGFLAPDMTVTEFVEALPSVTPQPTRPKGEWEIESDCEGKTRTCTCKLCNYKTGKYQWKNPNYCANCGADMRGDKNE